MVAAGFAVSLARDYELRGGVTRDLFASFVALVSSYDERACGECLKALDSAILEHYANGKT